jgi:hypothetical protein
LQEVLRWQIRPPALAAKLAAFAVERRVATTAPPGSVHMEGVVDGHACAFARFNVAALQASAITRRLDRDKVVSDFVTWIVQQANRRIEQRDYHGALEAFAMARQASPRETSFLGQAMKCYAALQEREALRQVAEAVRRLDGVAPLVLLEGAEACEGAGETDAALALVLKSLETDPDNERANQLLSRLHRGLLADSLRIAPSAPGTPEAPAPPVMPPQRSTTEPKRED